MKKILVLNGPNINMLGVREKNIYGRRDFKSLCAYIESAAAKLGVHVDLVQSNYEGDIVTAIQNAYGIYDGIVRGAAAGYVHGAIIDGSTVCGAATGDVHAAVIYGGVVCDTATGDVH